MPEHSRPMWLKRVLVPFWILQLLCVAFDIYLGCAAIQNGDYYRELGYNGVVAAYTGGAAIWLSFSLTSLLLDVVEIICFASDRLNPRFFLASNLLKTLMWLVMFIFIIYDTVANGYGEWLALAIVSINYLIFLGPFIYSAVTFKRCRRANRFNRAATSSVAYEIPFCSSSTTNSFSSPFKTTKNSTAARPDIEIKPYYTSPPTPNTNFSNPSASRSNNDDAYEPLRPAEQTRTDFSPRRAASTRYNAYRRAPSPSPVEMHSPVSPSVYSQLEHH